MRHVRRGSTGLRRASRLCAVLVLGAGLALAPRAWAHEDEAPAEAKVEVLQAIAYLVNTPGAMDAIEDKVVDAQAAEDTSGVDLALVRRAQAALEDGDMARTRVLLQQSIGAGADLEGSHMRPILQVPPGAVTVSLATGGETGTTIVTDELLGRGDLTRADLGLLAFAAALAATGLLLSFRYRPAHSVHRLRAAPRGEGGIR